MIVSIRHVLSIIALGLSIVYIFRPHNAIIAVAGILLSIANFVP
jgi:hypothetical protein